MSYKLLTKSSKTPKRIGPAYQLHNHHHAEALNQSCSDLTILTIIQVDKDFCTPHVFSLLNKEEKVNRQLLSIAQLQSCQDDSFICYKLNPLPTMTYFQINMKKKSFYKLKIHVQELQLRTRSRQDPFTTKMSNGHLLEGNYAIHTYQKETLMKVGCGKKETRRCHPISITQTNTPNMVIHTTEITNHI